MANSFRFDTTISGSRVYDPVTSERTVVTGYKLPAYISSFSGKNISYYSGSTIAQIGISTSVTEASNIFNLTLYSNAYLVMGSDVNYSVIVPDYRT